jgi:glycosyltransferase involved in cell wall biosynthesis
MKIAFLSPFYPFRGGIAQFSDSLFSELRKEHQIKAFTFSRQYPKFLFPGSSQYVPDSDKNKNPLTDRILDSINPFTYGKTARLISEYLPELVLISYWMPFFAPSLGRVAMKLQKKNIKVVSILHNVIPHEKRFGDKALTKYFLRQNNGVVVLNEKSKNDLVSLSPGKKYNLQNHPLYKHYGNKIDRTEAREKLGIPPFKKVLLFFGLIRDYKGLNILIESMSRLDESYYLIIAGESYSDFTIYEQKIRELNLDGRIKLNIRYIPDPDVPLYFSASDVCILPYLSGTQSGITGIAYHFDLPVIVTDVGGLKEMVEDGRTGFVVKEPTPMLLTIAIKMYFDGGMKEKFIPYIKEFKKAYSWERFASELLNFAKKL